MYQGYRLKINNVILDNGYIARGSFSISQDKRIAETYTDANGIEHVLEFDSHKALIEFQLRKHDSDEHSEIIQVLNIESDIEVEYYDDKTDTYKTGRFRYDKVTFSHESSMKGKLQYNPTSITLEEY